MALSDAPLTGPWLDGESVYGLMRDFSVTFSVGVPTVWWVFESWWLVAGMYRESPVTVLEAIRGYASGETCMSHHRLNLLAHMEANSLPRPSALKSVCIGGSAAPRSMIDIFELCFHMRTYL